MKQTVLIFCVFFLMISCRTSSKITKEKKEVAVVESISFTNTKWVLASLNKKFPTFSMNEKPFILFKDNQEVSGNAGCNLFSGVYELNENSINFKNIVVTTSACPDLPIESDFLKSLNVAKNFIKNNQTLELNDTSGKTLAFFIAK